MYQEDVERLYDLSDLLIRSANLHLLTTCMVVTDENESVGFKSGWAGGPPKEPSKGPQNLKDKKRLPYREANLLRVDYSLGFASLTFKALPSTSFPSIAEIALSASASSVNSTKPKPLLLPETLSVITTAESKAPNSENSSSKVALVMSYERFPTYNFFTNYTANLL